MELCCLHRGIWTLLGLCRNGHVLIEWVDNDSICWPPELGIILNKLWVLKSHKVYAQCATYLKVHKWGICLFDYLKSQQIGIYCSEMLLDTNINNFHSRCCPHSASSLSNTVSLMYIYFSSNIHYSSCLWD